MKRIRRILSVLLVLTAVFSCIAPASFAASESTVIKYGVRNELGYGGYMAFGDSVTRGCASTPEGMQNNYGRYQFRNVYGSYPYLLSQIIGCTMPDDMKDGDGNLQDASFWPVAYAGQTLNSMMKWLGLTDRETRSIWDNTGSLVTAYGSVENMVEKLKTCSLFTIGLGMSDVLFDSLLAMVEGEEIHGLQDLIKKAQGNLSPEMVLNVVEAMYINFEYWKEDYPKFINYLRTQSPDATIVMVGMFNLLEGLTITDESILPIGNALVAITSLMNQQYRKWAEEYARQGAKVFYADITNVETPVLQQGISFSNPALMDSSMSAVHPSREGYAYIYRQILSVLPDSEEISDPVCPLEPIINVFNNDIKLDLGRFDHVNYVLLDGKQAKYSMDNKENPFELTVHCSKRTAKNLTIAVVQKDGKIAIYTYQLSYKNGEYSAFRIYSTNNSVKTAATLLKSITNIGSTILKAFAGLFKK